MECKKIGFIVIILVSILTLSGVFFIEPIAQDIEYHAFNDQRTYFGIPNFWNVASNLAFLLVGCMGLYSVFCSHRIKLVADMKMAYILVKVFEYFDVIISDALVLFSGHTIKHVIAALGVYFLLMTYKTREQVR